MHINSLMKLPLGRAKGIGSASLLQSWRDALLECLSPALRRRMQRRESRLLLDLVGEQWHGRLEPAAGEDENFELPGGDDESLRQALQRAQKADAAVVLNARPGDVLLRRVVLPAQVRDNLERVLTYELDRLTPFGPDAVYLDHRLLSGSGGGQLEVELALVRRDRVEGAIEALNRIGARASALTWPGAWAGANLLPRDRRRKPNRAARVVTAVLWLAILGLSTALALVPLMQKNRIVEALDAQVSAARGKAAEAVELNRRLEEFKESSGYILEKKRQAVYVTEALRRLTEVVPDHSWVNQLNFNGSSIDFRGESRQATGLIELLSGDPHFGNISFKSPVVGIRNTDQERFHIEVSFKGGGDGT